jgi:hypothetical protein
MLGNKCNKVTVIFTNKARADYIRRMLAIIQMKIVYLPTSNINVTNR